MGKYEESLAIYEEVVAKRKTVLGEGGWVVEVFNNYLNFGE